MDPNKRKLIGDTTAGIIIFLGTRIPNLVMKSFRFATLDTPGSLDIANYALTSLFLFILTLYIAYIIRSRFR